eukprot:CAMPEP_0118948530 /NCGR_PEP_ID=MMETSP1169-20130426/48009_1 /TAXON_ID=36882 /ORGANISM="Pyramimonas obovata, Strain CCMP722" /LENGTH=52 /DNA_ID=CAMNT_0006894993 /DNA_START=461 /DNA_END=615 /DNA_ORIENTATION=-
MTCEVRRSGRGLDEPGRVLRASRSLPRGGGGLVVAVAVAGVAVVHQQGLPVG